MQFMCVDSALGPEDMGLFGGCREGLDIGGGGKGQWWRWEHLGWRSQKNEKPHVSCLSPYSHWGL